MHECWHTPNNVLSLLSDGIFCVCFWLSAAAGCPSVIANLWDVTDRDIDRFCQSLLQNWVEPPVGATRVDLVKLVPQPAAVSSCNHQQVMPCNSERGKAGATGLSSAVGRSRGACRLPSLIGAAPVCYGLPTTVSWKGAFNSDTDSASTVHRQ